MVDGRSSSYETLFGVMQHGLHLLAGHAGKPLEKVLDACPALKVFKKSPHGDTGSFKHPGPTHFVGVSLDWRTLTPINHQEQSAILPQARQAWA